jgi:hypothetical protein
VPRLGRKRWRRPCARADLPVAYLLFAHEQHGFRRAETSAARSGELYFYGKVLGFRAADRIEPVEIANLPADGRDAMPIAPSRA